MKLPWSWIGEFVDIADVTPEEYAHALTMSGSMVEGIENAGSEIKNVVVGKIEQIERHPDADKLVVCQLNVGSETIQIVTGAPNVKVGQLVPVALHKSTLPGGVKITKGKLRGVLSMGMMCSHEELGMALEDYAGACEDGILILQEDIAPGTDICDALNLNENVIDFDITSNRADCFSVIGMARETAATFDKPLHLHKPEVKGGAGDVKAMAKVDVLDTEACPRYAARVVKNVKIAPSPKWMQDRLKNSGIRAINNIVDITNYILLEYGQPMHAFDLDRVAGRHITVRRAKDGEPMVTLDGAEHTLDSEVLVISDEEKAVALAGVMGGENSEITDDAVTVLFECANFEPTRVRRSAKKAGLRTEASSRYEKGLDPEMIPDALNRACELVELLGAGEVCDGMIDVNHAKDTRQPVPFVPEKINQFLGTQISGTFMLEALKKLGFTIDGDTCLAPTYRIDIHEMADVAEEVVRMYGYDKLPTTPLRGETTMGGQSETENKKDQIKAMLCGMGMYEIFTYTFTTPKMFDLLKVPQDSSLRNVVRITNPLGEDTSVMRTTTIGAMMDTVARNVNLRNDQANLFEIGKVYLPQDGAQLPEERDKITMAFYGGGCDFYTIKGAVEALLDGLGAQDAVYTACTDNFMFHPGRCAKVEIGGKDCGVLGEMHPSVIRNYGLKTRVYMAELDLADVLEKANGEKQFKPLPKYPAVTRDIAVLVDKTVPVYELEKVIRSVAGDVLEQVKLFDVYQGEQVPEDKKSVAYALVMRSHEGTLEEETINDIMKRTVEALDNTCGAKLR